MTTTLRIVNISLDTRAIMTTTYTYVELSSSWIFGDSLKNAIGILIDNFECTVWKETHGYSTNSVHLIWWSLQKLPNCQIKSPPNEPHIVMLQP